MSEIDSCVRICKNYYRFRKFIAVFSTICEVNFFSTNFAFGHLPEICPWDRENIFTGEIRLKIAQKLPEISQFQNKCRTRNLVVFHVDARYNGFFRLECTCTGRFWVVFKGNEPLKFVWYSSIPEKALPWTEPRILSHQTSKSVEAFGP